MTQFNLNHSFIKDANETQKVTLVLFYKQHHKGID